MKQTFTAIIQKHGEINGAYVEPPFDPEAVFGAKRIKVKATFDGTEYRGSLVRMGGIYMLGMTQELRKKIGKDFGDEVLVTVEKDEEERKVEIPKDLEAIFQDNPDARENLGRLNYTAQKEYITWIESAKREATRQERLQKTVERLNQGLKLK